MWVEANMVFSRMGCVSIRAHLRSLSQVYRIFLVRVIHFSFSFIFFLLVISEACSEDQWNWDASICVILPFYSVSTLLSKVVVLALLLHILYFSSWQLSLIFGSFSDSVLGHISFLWSLSLRSGFHAFPFLLDSWYPIPFFVAQWLGICEAPSSFFFFFLDFDDSWVCY